MHGPIQWLNEGIFSAAAKNRIYSRILSNLPCYKRHANLLQEQGVKVPGELGEVSLESPINLLVYDNNYGCSDVAEELKTMIQNQGKSVFLNVCDASMILQKNSQEIDSGLNDAATNSQAEILYDPSLLTPPLIPDAPTFFLLYLNKHTFEGSAQDQHELTAIIQSCIDDSEISIVLVHEKDAAKGGVEKSIK
jgi:MarR-like DNA-binding transcriptional regulator SgrR of sgrS sRNA